MVGRKRPILEVLNKAVFAWIAVDIAEQHSKISDRLDRYSVEVVLEERASAAVCFIDRFGVRGKEIVERFGDRGSRRDGVGLDPHQNVKMIPQQAVRKGLGDRGDVRGIQGEEVDVIPFFEKDVLAINAAVEYMIIAARS